VAWNQRKGRGGGGGFGADEMANLLGRWERVAEWRPDATQIGFPGTLVRFSQVGGDTLVQPTGADFNTGFRHRQLLRDISAATAAAVLREALDAGGNDGNQSCIPIVGFEVFAKFRLDAIPPTGGWTLIGAFTSAGPFPFADVWGLAGQVGLGRSSLATATPAGALEAIATNGTAPANRTRVVIAGGAAVGQWQEAAIEYRPATDAGGLRARIRLHNLVTGVVTEQILTTTLPLTGALHAGIIHDVGVATPSGPANISIARLAVGYPA
jgi:hypothetical protein